MALFAASALADHAPHYGYGPKYHCRDTNTSVYAEVCVPAFAERVTPVTLDVLNVVDNDYCYNQIRTVCEETETVVQREICTYTYSSVKSVQPATTTQVSAQLLILSCHVRFCHDKFVSTTNYYYLFFFIIGDLRGEIRNHEGHHLQPIRLR